MKQQETLQSFCLHPSAFILCFMIRILVVDDSAVVRQSTKFILESDPELQVVGEAGNGIEALALAERCKPDVITMDVQMPRMDGLAALREIMAAHPVPVVIVTGLDLERETELSTQAKQLGAVAVLQRPAGFTDPAYKSFAAQLVRQVKAMSAIKVIHRTKSANAVSVNLAPPAVARNTTRVSPQVLAIGASTGGPAALRVLLGALPSTFPLPIVITQHISFGFIDGLASWLDDACGLRVCIAKHGERIEAGHIYLAPDDVHLRVEHFGRLRLTNQAPFCGHRPAVNVMFQSVADSYGAAALGALLTGMGADGAAGLLAMRRAGALTIAQDESSCVVFGMPNEAIKLGAALHVARLERIAPMICGMVKELAQ
ncbi:MAG: chemotaxis response regulator protein-glutamate methylesterase [Chloroflexi bacterium]|nr:chemotaxis response regulator protein-glutamate methylesterase [Chloroflexota bacterium]